MTIHTWSPIRFHGTGGKAPFILLCEHASKLIPEDFGSLGLDARTQESHAAWDIGALDVATALSDLLDAPLVAGGVSRLIYDCNRPPDAPDSMPAKSEIFSIPGNENLTEEMRTARHALIHEPFHHAAEQTIRTQVTRCREPVIVITIHSFTPVYHGGRREVEIGFLHDQTDRFSKAIQKVEEKRGRYKSALNQPYDVTDGVTHTLRRHAEKNGLDSTMIEVRNDLIDTPEKAREMAHHLSGSILQAHRTLQGDSEVPA